MTAQPVSRAAQATHGASSLDHASVAEQIVEQSSCPVLMLRNGCPDLKLQPSAGETPVTALVATDLTASAERAMSYAFELARVLPMRVHLLHVVAPTRTLLIEPGPYVAPVLNEPDPAVALARLQLESLVPEDLKHRVQVHAEVGDPAEMIATDVGLGYMLFLARDFYRTEVIILGMVVVGTLWLLLDRLVLAPWERATIERWGMVRAA